MMQFTDRAEIAGFRKTADGYLAGEVRCARTGCQQYLAREIGLMGDGVVTVYRPPEAVFDKASLATYSGKPVTMGHPPVQVTADNWKDYSGGSVGTAREDGDFVLVPIAVMDAAMIGSVEANEAREISMGYTTEIEVGDGVAPDGTEYQAKQTGPIRINHLAIVPAARGGKELRIGDGVSEWGASPVTVNDKGGQMADLRKIMVDGLQVETTDAGAAAIEKLTKAVADAKAETAEAKALAEKEKAEMEAEMAKKDAAIAAADAAKLTDAAIDARVQARADLIGKARAVVADVATAGVADADIRKAVVVAKLGDAALAGKSQAYIDARFDILAEDAAKADPVKDAKLVVKPVTDKAAMYDAYDAKLQDAWKGV
jgi:uncharacterized protein